MYHPTAHCEIRIFTELGQAYTDDTIQTCGCLQSSHTLCREIQLASDAACISSLAACHGNACLQMVCNVS